MDIDEKKILLKSTEVTGIGYVSHKKGFSLITGEFNDKRYYFELNDYVIDWCLDNFNYVPRTYITRDMVDVDIFSIYIIHFRMDSDAMAFKLRWI